VSTGKAERKYLERHAEPEAAIAERLGSFGHAVVIPAFGEGDELFGALGSIPLGPAGDVLAVVVVNGKSSAPAWMHDRNRTTLARCRQMFGVAGEPIARDPPAWLFKFVAGHVLCLDRSAQEHWFPNDQGVGLARKIGVDLCLRLHTAGRLVSPFIHSTDADVELPSDYFERAAAGPRDAAALLYPFVHRPDDDPDLGRAVLLYEISLRYYVLGLRFAGSRYAFHTIGSTIATHAAAYARVRGVPKRDAAEDFYLLSKLAKVGPIVPLAGRPLTIRGRRSNRVPFGTGAAVGRIAALGSRPFTVYDPRLFVHLRAWLVALADVRLYESDGGLEDGIRQACMKEGIDPAPLLRQGRELGAPAAVASARRRSRTPEALRRHLETWFDAFRTLKLVHALERGGFAPRVWSDALGDAPFARDALGVVPTEQADLVRLRALCESLARMELGGVGP